MFLHVLACSIPFPVCLDFGLWTLDLAHLHSVSSAHGLDVYFKDLWLLAPKYHVFWLNRAGSKDRESPYKKVWGKDYEVHPNDHNFGSLCYYKIDKAALINKGDMRGEPRVNLLFG